MATITAEEPMAKDRKNLPVRIDEESIKWGKIAASYKDMTLSDYVSMVVLETAKRDVDRSHAEMTKAESDTEPAKPSTKRAGAR